MHEVCEIARDLIRFDTSNYGNGHAKGERKAAEYVCALLEEVGLHPQIFEAEPGRTNVIARWQGRDPTAPALLLHGHLDVVPADASEWTVDPFAGIVKDGMLWGRGAVDMKDMNAMILATVRSMMRAGEQPNRDVVLAFFADEEAGSDLGARWMVEQHPEVFTGVSAAISEVGGFSVDIRGRNVYLVQTAEKGLMWLRLRAKGKAGHASQVHTYNPLIALAEAVVRLDNAKWPIMMTRTTTELDAKLREIGSFQASVSAMDVARSTGACAAFVTAGLHNLLNVTMFNAGYKQNVVPDSANALVDVRFLPGQRDHVLAKVHELIGPDIEVEIETELVALETEFPGPLFDAISATIDKCDPVGEVVPYMTPAGTDNKALAQLGISGLGFVPLRLPADFDFPAMFHGVDERVPLDALVFGQEVLTELLRAY
ncbi:M20/M25/M40 family metallo-hydrolase (plasmid) [Rhodococcus globerulus]|uniref:M20/M25/M40 family metallo-hydrolase n=1 Tax=Rhodococcus globerulus TaxID=33008 RepID=UPI0039EA84E0